MKKFIKLYWPISISILFMFIIGILIGTTFYGDALFEYDLIGFSLVLYTLILVIVIYAEMIYFMVKACKCNEIKNKVLWCLSLYLFNVFVFPYFNLKYICKNKNNKISMIVFILLIIASIILGINITCNVEKKYVNKYITIEEDDVLIKFSGNYRKTKIGDYDFYIKDSKRQINIGGFIYDEDDNTTPSKILSERKSWINFYRSPSQFLETFKLYVYY